MENRLEFMVIFECEGAPAKYNYCYNPDTTADLIMGVTDTDKEFYKHVRSIVDRLRPEESYINAEHNYIVICREVK